MTSGAPAALPVGRDLGEVMAKAIIASLFTLLAVRLAIDFLQTGRLTGLLLLASESLNVVLTIFRRSPVAIDRSFRARLVTAVSLLGPLLVVPAALAPLVPEAVTVSASATGLLVIVAGKLSLGRSLGLMPANRGIVSTGLYKIVRHPIYLGYLVTHVAFLAAQPSPWNIAALVTGDIALLARAVREEMTLAQDAEYREYQSRVRWRVVPGVF